MLYFIKLVNYKLTLIKLYIMDNVPKEQCNINKSINYQVSIYWLSSRYPV